MPLSGMLTCGNCGARSQMNTMRYNLSGTRLICPACVDKERSGIKPGTTQSRSIRLQREQMQQKATARAPFAEAGEMQPEASGTGMAKYYCRSCHFKFSRKRDAEIGTCPYCGRETVSTAYEGKAQDLIEESAQMGDGLF